MNTEALFLAANAAVLPAWLLLMAVPRWRWTGPFCGRVMPALLAVFYIVLIAAGDGQGSFLSLAGVRRFFDTPLFLLAGWVHYLAFDLFVGAWEVEDARRRGLAHGVVVPCLILTLLFGPAGFLLYLGMRRGVRPGNAEIIGPA